MLFLQPQLRLWASCLCNLSFSALIAWMASECRNNRLTDAIVWLIIIPIRYYQIVFIKMSWFKLNYLKQPKINGPIKVKLEEKYILLVDLSSFILNGFMKSLAVGYKDCCLVLGLYYRTARSLSRYVSPRFWKDDKSDSFRR